MTTQIAFVCVQNAGRSQMATAFAERERAERGLGDAVDILTGGTRPADRVHDAVVTVMDEVDIDLSDRTPAAITTADLNACDVVVTMGCSTLDLDADDPDVRDWNLADPDGEDLDVVRSIRDEIRTRVRDLVDEIEGRPATDGGRPHDAATQRRIVRERYADIATGGDADCCADAGCCDGGSGGESTGSASADQTAQEYGYSAEEVDSVAGDANLGLGCGNPQALAALSPGETVLDLGSGAGFDCFLAADEVGSSGRVIGVDMTPEMVEKARANARTNDADHVSFRLGEIEHLPVADECVDAIISNCVVNLSPDKPQVFREAHRVLRPGGRLAISDVVQTAPIPDGVGADPDSVASCVAGASRIGRLEAMLADAGFEAVEVAPTDDSERFIREWDDDRDVSEFLVSAAITARKPERTDE